MRVSSSWSLHLLRRVPSGHPVLVHSSEAVVSASPRSVSSSWLPPKASLSCLLCPLLFPFHPTPHPGQNALINYPRFSISTLLLPATHSIHVQSCII